jgi:uncharacterized protein
MRITAMLRQPVLKAYLRSHWLIQRALVGLIAGYRYLISPWLGNRCRFYPSCSEYAEQAILERGIVRGLLLSVWRLLRCHPWHPGGYDPVNQKSIMKEVTPHEF